MDAIERANNLAAEGLAKLYYKKHMEACRELERVRNQLTAATAAPADVEITRGRKFELIAAE